MGEMHLDQTKETKPFGLIISSFLAINRSELPPLLNQALYRHTDLGRQVELKPIEELRRLQDLAQLLIHGRKVGSYSHFCFQM
jgi:hypothetical protein